jgi:sRNA-binding carbon storage regulator CsrA
VVTLTFNAPRNVEIARLEVWQRKQREMGASILGERPTGTVRD